MCVVGTALQRSRTSLVGVVTWQFSKLLKMYMQVNKFGQTEADIMAGAMSLSDKHVKDIMTPRDRITSLKIRLRMGRDACALSTPVWLLTCLWCVDVVQHRTLHVFSPHVWE